jgi:DNA-directed RNA polymerase subunit RPC12/RpoP
MMDLTQNLAPVIADLEAEGARIAATVAALRELCLATTGIARRAATETTAAVEMTAPAQISHREEPKRLAARVERAPKRAPRKQRAPRATIPAESNTRQRILNHILSHPGSTRTTIAEAVHVSESCVGYHLTRLKKNNSIEMHGAPSTGITWSPVGKPQAAPLPRKRTSAGRQAQELNYPCEACRAKFMTAAQLAQHNEIHHGGQTAKADEWVCAECGKTFRDELDYEAHMEAIHDIEI